MSRFEAKIEPERSPSLYDDDGDELEEMAEDEEIDPSVFAIRRAIEPASTERISMEDLHEKCHQCTINLEPDYQREPVWPIIKRIGLIDSIFRNIWIPPLVFSVHRPPGYTEDVWNCVDGKQRLTSIRDFMDGLNPYKDPDTKVSWYYTGSRTKNKQIIPETYKDMFNERTVPCVLYRGLSDADEREIFQRIQHAVPLQAGEKARAINSPRANWIRRLEAQHVTVTGGLVEHITFETSRGRSFLNIAFMAWLCEGYPGQTPTPTFSPLTKWLDALDEPSKHSKVAVDDALRTLGEIAQDPGCKKSLKQLQDKKRIAPVEFIFIGILLVQLKAESLPIKTNAICNMVSGNRDINKDVRMNTQNSKVLWRYIDHLSKHPTEPLPTDNPAPAPKKKVVAKKRKADDMAEKGQASGSSGPPMTAPPAKRVR